MNPNENPIAPDCFHDYKQYSEWMSLARLAREKCTICEDCTSVYKSRMVAEQRCHEQWHSSRLITQNNVYDLIQKKINIKEKSKVKEIQIDPLYW